MVIAKSQCILPAGPVFGSSFFLEDSQRVGDRDACTAGGMDGYIAKIVQPALLQAVIERGQPGT